MNISDAIRKIQKNLETKNTSLVLSNLGLTGDQSGDEKIVYELLGQCSHLLELDLSHNRITKINGLEKLYELKTLFLHFNQIEKVSGLENLSKIKSLYLSNNIIKEISGLENLLQLNTLNLHYNKISQIKGLDNLLELCVLNLHSNEITEIKGLENLTKLNLLNIQHNRLKELKGLKNLSQLHTLHLSDNEIREIKGLESLSLLRLLNLSENQITEIKGLENLSLLNILNLHNNQISEIKGLECLSQLNTLTLGANNITEIKGLEKLLRLNLLVLENNKITDLKGLLHFLKRKHHPLKIVSEEMTFEGEINVIKNPIVTPPAIVIEKGPEAILRFFEGALALKYEAKILIVGEPDAGKTSLIRKLTTPEYRVPSQEKSTIGIKVEKWKCKTENLPQTALLNMWDFGGQEMQYLTHQFFLSPDALYILLTSARRDFDNLDYWFNIISLLGKNENNENSELIVVANERQMQEGQVAKTFDEVKYRELYPHLPFTFHQVNLATDADKDGRFNALLYIIKKKVSELPVMGKELPVKWGTARQKLNELNADYIFLNDYLKVCQSVHIDNKFAMDLSAYLHTIGEIVHFKTDNFIILNPKWAVDGVYSILKRDEIEKNGGHFTRQQMHAIWQQNYTQAEENLLTDLMTKDRFEVAYKLPEKKEEYIAPQLLPLIQPGCGWDKSGVLHFRYWYPFMPKGIITRLIVRMHENIKYENEQGLVWRTGVYLKKFGCTAKVEETKITDTGQQVIAIEITGNNNHRKFFLYDISRTIESIHKDFFSKINFERQVPCSCEFCKNQPEPAFFDYTELIEYINEGIDKIRCKKKVKNQILVKDLLQDIFDIDLTYFDKSSEFSKGKGSVITRDPFNVNTKQKKIFLSYSQKDSRHTLTNGVVVNFKEEFETQLKQLKRFGIADTWNDTNLLAGEDWDASIKREIENADIIVFLVSANLIATDYVWNSEIPLAKFGKEMKNKTIIPVILNHCQWKSIPLFSIGNVLPHKGKPVINFNNRDEAYDEIIAKIKEAIERL